MRTVHDWSPLLWSLMAAGAVVLALGACGFFSVVWLLTHSD
jgi:hypothetical protein